MALRKIRSFPTRRSSDLRPVKAAELFAFTLRVRAGNTDVLTDAEENVSVSCAYTRSEERFSRNAETDLVCGVLLEKKGGNGAERGVRDLRARGACRCLT